MFQLACLKKVSCCYLNLKFIVNFMFYTNYSTQWIFIFNILNPYVISIRFSVEASFRLVMTPYGLKILILVYIVSSGWPYLHSETVSFLKKQSLVWNKHMHNLLCSSLYWWMDCHLLVVPVVILKCLLPGLELTM